MAAHLLERPEIQSHEARSSVVVPVYQLDKRSVDVPSMVDRALSKLPLLKTQALRAAVTSPVWGRDYPSLKDLPSKSGYGGFRIFEPQTGTIAVPGELPTGNLRDFYTQERRIDRYGLTVLRGPNYYKAAIDATTEHKGKVKTMETDMREGLDVLKTTDRTMLEDKEYLLLLGVMDYLKLHSLTMFHAVTYGERKGDFNQSAEYQGIREEARSNMVHLTRAFYQASLGHPFDADFDPEAAQHKTERVGEYLREVVEPGNIFTFPEVTHPLRTMLGSHQAVLRHPNVDQVVGIPSGGTEPAIATAQMYELMRGGTAPKLTLVPLSVHGSSKSLSHDVMVQMLKDSDVKGRSVLIVDDNSNTGTTLQKVANAAAEAGAGSINAHIVELDPQRIIYKQDKFHNGKDQIVNLEHPDFETALGIVPITEGKGKEVRRRVAKKVIRVANSDHNEDHRSQEKQRRKELVKQVLKA